jgi:hypothetical protein
VSTAKAERILGIKFRPVMPEMIAYLTQALEEGRIEDPRKKPKKKSWGFKL